MQKVNCDICDSGEFKIIYESTIKLSLEKSNFSVFGELGQYYRIVQCSNCGLVYSNPRDNSKDLDTKYEDLTINEYLKAFETRLITANKDSMQVKKLLSKGKILDIGCSAGLFLSSLGSNFETVGIEPSKAAFREAQKITPNSTLYNKKLSDVHFQNEEFDIITMWDVIEHFDSPNKSLKLINKILKLNGYLILVTPNFSGLLSIAMRKRWIHLIRGHLFYFNKDTIEKILSINNFEVIKIKSYIRYFKISYLLTRVGLIKKEFKVPKFLKFLDFTVPINLSDSLLIVAKKIN